MKKELIKLGASNPELRPHIRAILGASKKYYWASDRPIEIGARVPAFKGNFESSHKRHVEALFEEVRREVAPSAPSRIGSVMVCPSRKGFCSGWRPYLYEVKVKGKVFHANAEYFTMAVESSSMLGNQPKGDDSIRSIAEDYWTNPNAPFMPEVLVDGVVTVVRQLQGKEASVSWSPEMFFRKYR